MLVSQTRVVLGQTRVLLMHASARAGQGQMLHRREILTAAGESLCALCRLSLNNQEVGG